MAYFNHAFQKTFLGTGATVSGPVTTAHGFVTSTGVPTVGLNTLSAAASSHESGYFGLFDVKGPTANQTSLLENCCNVYLAGSTLYSNDKIGPVHGGYQETNKSKMINPRYVANFYRVDACTPTNNVINVGVTPFTESGSITTTAPFVAGTETYVNGTYTDVALTGGTGTGALATVVVAGNIITSTTVTNDGLGYTLGNALIVSSAAVATPGSVTELVVGTGTTIAVLTVSPVIPNCCPSFLCGETYYLRLDIKGSPALRFLNHNAYYTASFYTGCCAADDITPDPVDSTLVMIGWATDIMASPIVNPFIQIVVSDQTGGLWYAPGTVDSLGNLVLNTWDLYVCPGYSGLPGECAGMIMYGAYVDTKFGDCTFQNSDFYEKEPVKLYASMVDLNGDPCAFATMCVVTECQGNQAMGLGESVLRDLIQSEAYRQNFFHSDLRIREITQGNQIVNAINRSALYTKYYILHNVPRFNNPSSTFDNDRYLLEIITNGPIIQFENAVNTWLESCGTECAFEVFDCVSDCDPIVPLVPVG